MKLIFALLIIIFSIYTYGYTIPSPTYDDYKIGSSKAPVVLIEYSSLSCPACAQVNNQVIQPLINDYVLAGKLLYIHRDFAIDKPGLLASILAHCVDREEYFNLEKVLFEHQKNWAYTNQYVARLKNIGQLSGLTADKIDQCFSDEALRSKLKANTQKANREYGVDAVPAIFINGKKVNSLNLGKIKQLIDIEINQTVIQNRVLRKK